MNVHAPPLWALVLLATVGCSVQPRSEIPEESTHFCTIFHLAEDGLVLAGNNEDWSDPLTRFWIIPGEGAGNGWIKFGFAGGFPQGGMNDQGLFWDATGSPYLDMPLSEAHKTRYDGPLMEKVMVEAGSVAEAREIFQAYFCDDQYRAQYLVGDSSGASMIVEGDGILPKTGRSQILTNFYQSQPGLGGYPCWRYETAAQMLGQAAEVSAELVGQVLAATHQEGRYPTQYSMIYDLPRLRVYLFHYHNFQEFIAIDLEEELLRGPRSYDLPTLFSKVEPLAPADGASVTGTTGEIRWRGRTTSSYDLCLSTSPDPSGSCTRIQPDVTWKREEGGVLLATLVVFLGLFAWPGRRQARTGRTLLVLCAVTFAAACAGDATGPSGVDVELEEMSHTVSGLSPGSTYYWKLLAEAAPGTGFSSETLVFSFSTGG